MATSSFGDNLPLILDAGASAFAKPEEDGQIVRLYQELGPGVYQYLLFLGLAPELAEDQCQECFLELCKALHARKRIEHPRKWLFSVAYRLAMDALSAGRRQVAHPAFQDLDIPFEHSDPGPNPEQTTLELDQHRRFRQAVANLSPQQRNCLHLRSEGLRHREIAEVLGINVKTVSEFLHRAINNLRNSLR
jgi:RNA polymerase sigma-70 factor (ECF subfamily)